MKRLGFEMNNTKLWNMKHLCIRENTSGTEKCFDKFWISRKNSIKHPGKTSKVEPTFKCLYPISIPCKRSAYSKNLVLLGSNHFKGISV